MEVVLGACGGRRRCVCVCQASIRADESIRVDPSRSESRPSWAAAAAVRMVGRRRRWGGAAVGGGEGGPRCLGRAAAAERPLSLSPINTRIHFTERGSHGRRPTPLRDCRSGEGLIFQIRVIILYQHYSILLFYISTSRTKYQHVAHESNWQYWHVAHESTRAIWRPHSRTQGYTHAPPLPVRAPECNDD